MAYDFLKVAVFCAWSLGFLACSEPSSATDEAPEALGQEQFSTPAPLPQAKGDGPVTVVTPFQNADGTWGYDVFVNGRRFITQPHMPAVGGNAGFATESQAQAVGKLVQHKIEEGMMPPSLSAAEVDSLIAIFN